MEGLPQNPGALGLAMVLLGILLAAFCAVLMRRPPGATSARAPFRKASPALAIALAAISISPYVAWRIVEDIRYTSGLDSWIADRYGVSVAQVHPAIFDAAAAHMPAHARYFLATAPSVDSTRRQAFEQWAVGWLLPRVATSTPEQAPWILTLGVPPSTVVPHLKHTWRIWPAVNGAPAAYLGQAR